MNSRQASTGQGNEKNEIDPIKFFSEISKKKIFEKRLQLHYPFRHQKYASKGKLSLWLK